MVLTALGMYVVYMQKDAIAGDNSKTLLEQFGAIDEVKFDTESGMPEKEYQGYTMIGTLRIASLGMELPVLSSWNYEKLEVAPCQYSGSVSEGNLILMGHSYRSHFRPLYQIEKDAEVEFEDVNGILYKYVVEEIEEIRENEVEKLTSEYELTLFTCTVDGEHRLIVRCGKSE